MYEEMYDKPMDIRYNNNASKIPIIILYELSASPIKYKNIINTIEYFMDEKKKYDLNRSFFFNGIFRRKSLSDCIIILPDKNNGIIIKVDMSTITRYPSI